MPDAPEIPPLLPMWIYGVRPKITAGCFVLCVCRGFERIAPLIVMLPVVVCTLITFSPAGGMLWKKTKSWLSTEASLPKWR